MLNDLPVSKKGVGLWRGEADERRVGQSDPAHHVYFSELFLLLQKALLGVLKIPEV